MLPILRHITPTLGKYPSFYSIVSTFHTLLRPSSIASTPLHHPQLLRPTTSNLVPSCGFKVKGLLRRRCRSCYFVRREERLFVICDKHPRHKQMSMVKDPKNTWILTHATQGKVRPW